MLHFFKGSRLDSTSKLSEVVQQSIIICYKESVDKIYQCLEREKLNPVVARATYTKEEQKYSGVYRCFMGHRDAWIKAAGNPGYTLICEADFVPCAGLGRFPVFWPLEKQLAWGYLYQGSPRLLWLSKSGHLRGHASPTVAYLINSVVAKILIQFFEYETEKYRPEEYFTFEAHLQWWAMGRGAEAYFPPRHYGEHGGRPQAEHTKFGLVSRNGFHHADNLQAPLAFLPQYANGSRLRYLTQRMVSRSYGWARLLFGRWVIKTDAYKINGWDAVRMYLVGVRRLLS